MNNRTHTDALDGLLLVDKPAGMTSHDVVHAIRRHFGIRKVGHGGTLDPAATGLLMILLGRGTKLSAQVMSSDKTYEGIMLLGTTTDSQDMDGEIVREADCSNVTAEQISAEMQKRTGDIMQTPPMVSAVKKDGVPLYKLARKGVTVEREARLIHIYSFKLLNHEPPRAQFRIKCTKGTYVRTLCHDIGEALGCGACLESLRRTQSGAYSADRAMKLDDLLKLSRSELEPHVIPFLQVKQDEKILC
ncbi:MAG: tRNA pseudouridine(55) synthase TruB [Kiritimatiellia bacterium]